MRTKAIAMGVVALGCLLGGPQAMAQQQQGQDEVVEETREAQIPNYQLQRFRPAPGASDYVTMWSTSVAPHLDWSAGAFFNHSSNPMQLGAYERPERETVVSQSQFDALASVGLWDRVEVGLVMPWTIRQRSRDLSILVDPDSDEELGRSGLNDMRVSAKGQILSLEDGAVGLAAIGTVGVPTGRRNALSSEGGISAEALLAGEMVFAHTIRVAANAGFRYRPDDLQVRQHTLGNEVVWGVGVHTPFITENMDLLAEAIGAVSVQSSPERFSGISRGEVPAEVLGAMRYGVHDDWSITSGLAGGLGDGIGAPDWRVFVGIDGRWTTGGWWSVDYNQPGFEATVDPCDPSVREAQRGRLRFDPADCPEPIAETDPQEGKDRIDDPIGSDWEPPPPPEPEPEETAEVVEDEEGDAMLRQGAIVITERVTFETASADIRQQSLPILDDVAALILRHDDIRLLRVEGHTDNVGDAQMNLRLSEERAASVVQYLVDQGVDPERLTSIGYGEERPVGDNRTEDGRAQNRRVEFNIMEMGAP